ncbi:MAG: hypothetical protein ACTSRK_16940 [Promethearchaeota archaeon]
MAILITILIFGTVLAFLAMIGIKVIMIIKSPKFKFHWDWALVIGGIFFFFSSFWDIFWYYIAYNFREINQEIFIEIYEMLRDLQNLWIFLDIFEFLGICILALYIFKAKVPEIRHKEPYWIVLVSKMLLLLIDIFLTIILNNINYNDTIEVFLEVHTIFRMFLNTLMFVGLISQIKPKNLKSWFFHLSWVFLICSPLEILYFLFRNTPFFYYSIHFFWFPSIRVSIWLIDNLFLFVCLGVYFYFSNLSSNLHPNNATLETTGPSIAVYKKGQAKKTRILFWIFGVFPILILGLTLFLLFYESFLDIFTNYSPAYIFLVTLTVINGTSVISSGVVNGLFCGLIFPFFSMRSGKNSSLRRHAVVFLSVIVLASLINWTIYYILAEIGALNLNHLILIGGFGILAYILEFSSFFFLHNVFKAVDVQFKYYSGFNMLKVSSLLQSLLFFFPIITSPTGAIIIGIGVLIGVILYYTGLVKIVRDLRSYSPSGTSTSSPPPIKSHTSSKGLNTTINVGDVGFSLTNDQKSVVNQLINKDITNKESDFSQHITSKPFEVSGNQPKGINKDSNFTWNMPGISESEIFSQYQDCQRKNLPNLEVISYLTDWISETAKVRGFPLTYPLIYVKVRKFIYSKMD